MWLHFYFQVQITFFLVVRLNKKKEDSCVQFDSESFQKTFLWKTEKCKDKLDRSLPDLSIVQNANAGKTNLKGHSKL